MVYIYVKIKGGRSYYYLRASLKQGKRLVTKDIVYLGLNIDEVKEKLSKMPAKYSSDIRKAYKTLNRFIESNRFIEKVKSMKFKSNSYLSKHLLENIEACKLHWHSVFEKLDKETKAEIIKNFVIEFAFNTASIEGNTITLREAKKLFLEHLTPKDKTLREVYDLQNTETVFLNLFENLPKDINHEFICEIHQSLLKNIDSRIGYRTTDVRVFKSQFESTPSPYVFADMKMLLKRYSDYKSKLHPLVLAAIFHHKFEKIHPFMDGNGRTGRILMNYIFLSHGYPPIIISQKTRAKYLSALNKADKLTIDDFDVVKYKELVEFIANEFVSNYWRLFL